MKKTNFSRNYLIPAFLNSCILAFILFLTSCSNNEDIPVAPEPQMTGLATPLILQPDSTVIVLQDYFADPKKIDSVRTDPSLIFTFSADSARMVIFTEQKTVPKLSTMRVWIKGYCYTLLLEKSRKIWQHIIFDPKEKIYKKVRVAGEMNNWNPAASPLHLKDGLWQTDFLLEPGKYQYQFVIDGKWSLDPGNPEKADNNIGGFNSVLHAGSISPSGLPWLFTEKTDKNCVFIGVRNKPKEYFVLWQNYLLDKKFVSNDSSGLKVNIPRKALLYRRSFLRILASNAAGSSNELYIPLSYGKVITDPSLLERTDKEAMIIYFLMVDRFLNGNKKNDSVVRDYKVDPKLNWQGGDLAGVTQKIDDGYFTDLGVNTLWLSPLTQNPYDAWTEYPKPHRKFTGYHGYWPVTLSTVDKRFGTSKEMKKMVSEAHEKNMNVLLDYVSNHVHKESWLYREHPDWATPFILPDKRKNLRLWDEQRLTTWFDEFLPTLDLTNPAVCNMISDSALFWIKEYNLDGFRHDATKHIPEVYWRMLTRKLNEQVIVPENRPVYQIGETYGSRELIRSYINNGMLDAQFDFDLYFTARTVFSKDNASFRDLSAVLQQSFNFFGEHSLMGNITGNQDQSRFISLASGALEFNEDGNEAGWKRDIEVKDTTGYRKLASMMAFIMTIPGIPVIYYGDEFGMPGANDPDNRRMMRFENLSPQEQRMKSMTKRLITMRKTSMPLLYGDFRTLEVSDKVFAYMRTYFDKIVVIILNKDKNDKKIDLVIPDRFSGIKFKAQFGNSFTFDKKKLTVTVPGNSFEIIGN